MAYSLAAFAALREAAQQQLGGPLRVPAGGALSRLTVSLGMGQICIGARDFSSSSVSGAEASTSGRGAAATRPDARTRRSSKQGRQAQQQQPASKAPLPWGHTRDEDVPLVYSLRPSVHSPLFPIYRENQDLLRRVAFLDLSLTAQSKLANEIDARGDEQIAAELSSRRSKLGEVTNAFAAAARAAPVPPPASPEEGQGYALVLEQQLADRHPSDIEFKRVLQGERDVWDYWFKDFAPRYEGLPGLAPLDVALNRPSTLEEESALRRRALRTLIPREPPQQRAPRVDETGRARATGRRKTATAQVILWPGVGRVMVNRKPLDQYFSDVTQRAALLRPLMATGALGRVDAAINITGGGLSGQAQAAAHGVARALQNLDPASYRAALKRSGMLKRDPRMVERKKPGRAKARKAFAWVKR